MAVCPETNSDAGVELNVNSGVAFATVSGRAADVAGP
jgi:hypothetical protein